MIADKTSRVLSSAAIPCWRGYTGQPLAVSRFSNKQNSIVGFNTKSLTLKIAIDVHYNEYSAVVAGLGFTDWRAAQADQEWVKCVGGIADYEPGAFYKRELPCILSLFGDLNTPIDTIVIDGFVTLGPALADGLGMHLYRALGASVPIVGVAKRPFKDTPSQCELFRGGSQKPLFVTAAGMEMDRAKGFIAEMHGCFRLPTLLKRVDQLCRAG